MLNSISNIMPLSKMFNKLGEPKAGCSSAEMKDNHVGIIDKISASHNLDFIYMHYASRSA